MNSRWARFPEFLPRSIGEGSAFRPLEAAQYKVLCVCLWKAEGLSLSATSAPLHHTVGGARPAAEEHHHQVCDGSALGESEHGSLAGTGPRSGRRLRCHGPLEAARRRSGLLDLSLIPCDLQRPSRRASLVPCSGASTYKSTVITDRICIYMYSSTFGSVPCGGPSAGPWSRPGSLFGGQLMQFNS